MGNWSQRHRPSPSTFVGVVLGALVAAVGMYVYLNTASIEVLAAQADGVPLWSWYQAPFVLPEALAGGLVGGLAGVLVGRFRVRRPTQLPK